MADSLDIQDLREAIRDLRVDLAKIREKVTTDVNSAFGISRDLHQQQALMVAKLGVRIDATEIQTTHLLRLLQGDVARTGLVGRVEMTEQTVHLMEADSKASRESLQALQTKSSPCETHSASIVQTVKKIEAVESKLQEVEKALGDKLGIMDTSIKDLTTKEAQLRGGWVALGIMVGVISGLIALAIQIWKFLYP